MAVCAIGVDLNEIARAAPKAPLLQFVCGLGPRKVCDRNAISI
jgi:transcriptional accessory protein Tex/SPT6